jgi:hypothetical protein
MSRLAVFVIALCGSPRFSVSVAKASRSSKLFASLRYAERLAWTTVPFPFFDSLASVYKKPM